MCGSGGEDQPRRARIHRGEPDVPAPRGSGCRQAYRYVVRSSSYVSGPTAPARSCASIPAAARTPQMISHSQLSVIALPTVVQWMLSVGICPVSTNQPVTIVAAPPSPESTITSSFGTLSARTAIASATAQIRPMAKATSPCSLPIMPHRLGPGMYPTEPPRSATASQYQRYENTANNRASTKPTTQLGAVVNVPS